MQGERKITLPVQFIYSILPGVGFNIPFNDLSGFEYRAIGIYRHLVFRQLFLLGNPHDFSQSGKPGEHLAQTILAQGAHALVDSFMFYLLG